MHKYPSAYLYMPFEMIFVYPFITYQAGRVRAGVPTKAVENQQKLFSQNFLCWNLRWVLGCDFIRCLADFPMNNPPWRGYQPYRPRQQQRLSILGNLLPIVRALSTADLFDLLREIVLEVQFRLATLQANQARTPPHSPPSPASSSTERQGDFP